MPTLPFQKLLIWQKSMLIAKKTYEMTKNFPKDEMYGLSQQMRRAAVSIPSNIAEGSQKFSDRDFSRYLRISKGSLAELETQLLLAREFSYLSTAEADAALEEIVALSKMLRSFIATIATR